jgi:hypothetical protein
VDFSRGAADTAEGSGCSLDDITGAIVDSSYKLYRGLGPGLLESVYELILAGEGARPGFHVERHPTISLV